jgi:hypothetical protein
MGSTVRTESIEVIRVTRAVSSAEWLDDLQAEARLRHGSRLEFFAPNLGELAVKLMGSGEYAAVHKRNGQIGHVPVSETIELIESQLPDSFHEPCDVGITGLGTGIYSRLGNRQEVLVANMTTEELEGERNAVLRGIDLAGDFYPRWRTFRPRLKLANVRVTLMGQDLQELGEFLPDRIALDAGHIEPGSVELIP